MVDSTKVIGNQIICMAKEFILGRTAEGTKDSTKQIKSTAWGFMYGLMGGGTKEIGLMASNMAKASIYCQMALLK